mgnify:CR=1 FL=1
MKCHHCQKPLAKAPRYVEQRGWIRVRRSGETGVMRGRTNTGKMLCDACGDHYWHSGRFPSLIGEDQTTIEEMLG